VGQAEKVPWAEIFFKGRSVTAVGSGGVEEVKRQRMQCGVVSNPRGRGVRRKYEVACVLNVRVQR